MQIKRIQDLIKVVQKDQSIAELMVEEKGFKFHIKMAGHVTANLHSLTQSTVDTMKAISSEELKQKKSNQLAKQSKNRKYITSPIVGTFYSRTKPEAPPLAKVGDVVKPGKVVCIVESMKLFNEIESEISGTIVEVLVKDASPIEYGQELFAIE